MNRSPLIALLILLAACNQNKIQTDASGVFESDEVIVSAEQNGKLLSFPIREGDTLRRGAIAGQIDMSNTILQKQQVQATIEALRKKKRPIPYRRPNWSKNNWPSRNPSWPSSKGKEQGPRTC